MEQFQSDFYSNYNIENSFSIQIRYYDLPFALKWLKTNQFKVDVLKKTIWHKKYAPYDIFELDSKIRILVTGNLVTNVLVSD